MNKKLKLLIRFSTKKIRQSSTTHSWVVMTIKSLRTYLSVNRFKMPIKSFTIKLSLMTSRVNSSATDATLTLMR